MGNVELYEPNISIPPKPSGHHDELLHAPSAGCIGMNATVVLWGETEFNCVVLGGTSISDETRGVCRLLIWGKPMVRMGEGCELRRGGGWTKPCVIPPPRLCVDNNSSETNS